MGGNSHLNGVKTPHVRRDTKSQSTQWAKCNRSGGQAVSKTIVLVSTSKHRHTIF